MLAGLALPRELRRGDVLGHVLRAGGDDAGVHHHDEGLGLGHDRRDVVLVHDLLARVDLLRGVDVELGEDGLVLLRVEGGRGGGRGPQVREPAFLGLHGPLGGVAVAGEYDGPGVLVDICSGFISVCLVLLCVLIVVCMLICVCVCVFVVILCLVVLLLLESL